MIELTPLHEALVGELRDLYGAEKQLLSSLSRTASTVRTPTMHEMVARLLTDTSNQLWRLEEAFRLLDEDISSRHSLGMARILDRRKDGRLFPPDSWSQPPRSRRPIFCARSMPRRRREPGRWNTTMWRACSTLRLRKRLPQAVA